MAHACGPFSRPSRTTQAILAHHTQVGRKPPAPTLVSGPAPTVELVNQDPVVRARIAAVQSRVAAPALSNPTPPPLGPATSLFPLWALLVQQVSQERFSFHPWPHATTHQQADTSTSWLCLGRPHLVPVCCRALTPILVAAGGPEHATRDHLFWERSSWTHAAYRVMENGLMLEEPMNCAVDGSAENLKRGIHHETVFTRQVQQTRLRASLIVWSRNVR